MLPSARAVGGGDEEDNMRTTSTRIPRRRFFGTAALGALGAGAFGGTAQAAALTPAEQANSTLVAAFCAAWKAGDATKVGSHLSGDCVVRFIASTDGSPVVSGRAAVVKQVGEYLDGNTIEFIIKDTWASGPMVVNRRVDRIVSKNGSQDIEVVGVFFVREGKIKEWSDFIAEAV